MWHLRRSLQRVGRGTTIPQFNSPRLEFFRTYVVTCSRGADAFNVAHRPDVDCGLCQPRNDDAGALCRESDTRRDFLDPLEDALFSLA
jgi:hypothetical protein